MRQTQYIGLTTLAREYVDGLEPVESNNHILGMFDEEVPLGEWKNHDKRIHIKEVVQVEVWSSGPMIFTCLVNTKFMDGVLNWSKWKKDQLPEYED